MIFDLGPHQPVVHARSWIAPGAVVVGQVRLAEETSVWFGAVLRGDNDTITIGRGSNIQDGAVVHVDPGNPCVVGEGCVIGHRAVLHGCTVGNDVLIGIGAVVLNGATIGDGCLVGAGALVPEGKALEPDSLYLGVPARKVRALEPAERVKIQKNATTYVARAKLFKEQLASGAGRTD